MGRGKGGRRKASGRKRKASGQMWAERSQRKVLDYFEVYYDENWEEIHTVNKEQHEASAEEREMLENSGAKTNEALLLKNTEETDSFIRADAAPCHERSIGQETKQDVECKKSSDINKNVLWQLRKHMCTRLNPHPVGLRNQ